MTAPATTRANIEAIEIGSTVPTVHGLRTVVEIAHRGEDLAGRLFALVYVRISDTSSMSQTFKEGQNVYNVANDVVAWPDASA